MIMVTISNVVQDIINRHVFLQEAITQGIISYNKLAGNLKPEVEKVLGKTVKHNAIVMALRRYNEKLEKKQKRPTFNYFKEILLKTDVCYITVEESTTALNRVHNLHNSLEFKRGGIFNIIQGNYELSIITNQTYKEEVISLLSEEKILNVVEDLVVISLSYSRDYLFTPGVIYNVLRFIAWENINLISITLTPQELSLVVARNDTMRCYNTLDKLVKHTKKQTENK